MKVTMEQKHISALDIVRDIAKSDPWLENDDSFFCVYCNASWPPFVDDDSTCHDESCVYDRARKFLQEIDNAK